MTNYNMAALMGSEDITDEMYVQDFGLDPALAGTPRINDVMLERVETDNINHFIQQGMSEPDAKRKAGDIRLNTHKEIRRLLATKGLL